MGVSGGPNIIRDSSLVLELDAADRNSYVGSGTVWTDLSGNSNNGTLINSPVYINSNNGILNFAGGTYVSRTSPNLSTGNSGFTKSIWIKSQYKGTNTNHPNIISWGNDSTNNKNGLALQTDTTGTISQILHWFYANDYSCSINDITNNWANISITYNPPTLSFYLNGVNQSTQTVIGTPNVTNTNLEIGRYGALSQYYYSGSIANIQIYNRALTAQEILQNYNATKTRFGL